MSFRKRKKKLNFARRLTDADIELDLRITMIIVLAGTIGNTLGFIANLALYGMNFPTAFCAICALILILVAIFGLSSKYYRLWGWFILILLSIFEFPMLVFTYGSVMYPYMMIGFLGVLMLTKGKLRIFFNSALALYDVAVIILSSIHPFIFGPQDSTGLMGSAIVTYLISLGALTGCVIAWQNVSVTETSDVDPISQSLSRAGFLRLTTDYLAKDDIPEDTVLFFDVKNFNVINNICGVDGGNELLRKIVEMLKASRLNPKYVCRINSDHFTCLVDEKNIDLDYLNQLCQIEHNDNGKTIPLVMHCGIYKIENKSDNVGTMCDKAELACTKVRGGQSCHYFRYDNSIALSYQRENDLLIDLESAIQKREFIPYYQPIVDCATGKIVSAEALVRWKHPEHGILTPGVFVPILEKKELITELDSIMLEKVNSFMTELAGSDESVPVSINLSRIDLFDSKLMGRLNALVMGNSNPKVHYRFELTESACESIPESAVNALGTLRKHGAQILVDDFGTGYSSLGMITDFDFDYIKMDMSFAQKIEKSEQMGGVVFAVIEIAHKLGAKVIAEGVENETQYEFLKKAGCDCIQGYYFYKPMDEESFVKLLKAGTN